MRLINKSSSPKYCQLANATIKPGGATRELDFFSKFMEDFEKKTKGFERILSDKDIHLLAELCKKHLVPNLDDVLADAAIDDLKKTLKDPDGLKSIEDRAKAYRAAVQKARAEAIRKHNEQEARIRAESNIIGPDGNPIPKEAMGAIADKEKNLKPEFHPEMHNDLKSIIENNLAVMTSASGQPFKTSDDKKAVVAKPGGTPVSHNPKDYQKPRTVAPGQPDYFNN